MLTIVSKKVLCFHEIPKDCVENFKEIHWTDLSDAQSTMLRWVGDAIRGRKSQFFWQDANYCWYTDDTQSIEECVWFTDNNILMYEKITEKKLYRVMFKN